ncbi:hypothetical protein [Phytohalomonas tamaricis]|uniref:hypothetical protein n=1 Tax=Phytohalomonas tamaricis TaxID=2081032 RepID=UPI000D0B90FC
MEERVCDCTYCDVVVPESAVTINGKVFCCEACASAHPDRQPCQDPECDCYNHGWGGLKS